MDQYHDFKTVDEVRQNHIAIFGDHDYLPTRPPSVTCGFYNKFCSSTIFDPDAQAMSHLRQAVPSAYHDLGDSDFGGYGSAAPYLGCLHNPSEIASFDECHLKMSIYQRGGPDQLAYQNPPNGVEISTKGPMPFSHNASMVEDIVLPASLHSSPIDGLIADRLARSDDKAHCPGTLLPNEAHVQRRSASRPKSDTRKRKKPRQDSNLYDSPKIYHTRLYTKNLKSEDA